MSKKATKRPMFWVIGNRYDSEKAVNSILEKYGKKNVTLVDGVVDPVHRVFSSLMQSDLFEQSTKVIRVRGLPQDYNLINDYLQYVSEKRVLIIESPVSGSIGRTRFNAATSSLYKSFKSEGSILEFPSVLDIKPAAEWTCRVVQEKYKKEMTPDAGLLLCDFQNGNLDIIYSYLTSICSFLGKREKITIEDVESCVADEREFDIWRLVDNLLLGNFDAATSEMEKFWRKQSIYELESIALALISKLEILLFLRECGPRANLNEVKNKLAGFKKKSKSGGIEEKFSDQQLRFLLYSNQSRDIIEKTGTVRLTQLVSLVHFVANSIRSLTSDPPRCKMLMTNLCEVMCGRLQINDFVARYNSNNKLMVGNF